MGYLGGYTAGYGPSSTGQDELVNTTDALALGLGLSWQEVVGLSDPMGTAIDMRLLQFATVATF